MDEMVIRSEFTKGIITKIITKTIKDKLGITPEIIFNNPISVKKDGGSVEVHLNIDASVSVDDLSKLLKDLV